MTAFYRFYWLEAQVQGFLFRKVPYILAKIVTMNWWRIPVYSTNSFKISSFNSTAHPNQSFNPPCAAYSTSLACSTSLTCSTSSISSLLSSRPHSTISKGHSPSGIYIRVPNNYGGWRTCTSCDKSQSYASSQPSSSIGLDFLYPMTNHSLKLQPLKISWK